MKKILIAVTLSSCSYLLQAQYYYNELLGTQKTIRQWKLLKENKITSVTTKSFESDGQPSEGFLLQQKIDLAQKIIITTSQSAATGESVLTSYFNDKDELVKVVDENKISENTATYTYDSTGKLWTVESNAVSAGISLTEKHIWFYDSNGRPDKMLKIKNDKDTINIRINYDDKGNAVEEVEFAKGKQLERYFFYYNAKNQLSDIVRYNLRYKKMLPDYSFDYNEQNRLSEMTVYRIQSSGSDYLTWRYLYDDRGLKIKEGCFDRDRKIVGRIEYEYLK